MIDNAVFPRYAYVGIVRVKVMGHVEESDLIGAFFHDTKNVLKGKLDLQKLSEEQKIGRISVKKRYERGASFFECKLLFALDKQEVAFVLAALESIEKVAHSPCSVRVFSLGECEPEREKKIRTRALELEKTFFGNEDKKELKSSAPVFSYDRGAIFSGPRLAQAEEIILVEGRADVRKLLSFGMENVLSVN
ncbi:MAG: hypothetical protein KC548_05685, partial [Nanoarchaeota archaeon]|nr:hypothetical protein [Nanoarchaeota archaeon]